ncbi:MAG: nucleotidyltransferase domain-containing protein [Actinomycetota bacterium]
MFSISKTFLQKLANDFDDESTVGFLLTGSHARGEATPYSDVDLLRFITNAPSDETEKYILKYHDNYLISISTSTVEAKLKETERPETAIWSIPGLRQARIMADKNGSLTKLKQTAEDFVWNSLQKAADDFASYNLMGDAEEAHKILGSLKRKDESAVLYGTIGLLLGLTKIITVQCGMMIKSENSYFRQAQEEVGKNSAWSLQHKIACGFEQESSIETRGIASLRLYVETEKILQDIIKSEHSDVIRNTKTAIQQSSFKL